MAMHGDVGLCTAVYGYAWVCRAMYGCVGLCMACCGEPVCRCKSNLKPRSKT